MGGRSRSRVRNERRRSSSTLSRRRIVLIGAGAAVALGTGISTSAFSSEEAPRSSSALASDDPNAVIGLTGLESTDTKPTFTNNSSTDMSITLDTAADIDFDVGDNGTWEAPPVSFSLNQGNSEVVNVKGSVSSADVSIVATILDGSEVVGEVDMVREFVIPQAGGVIDISGSVSSAGASGKFSFDVENTGSQDAIIVGIGINGTTNPDTNRVDNGSILTIGGTQYVSSQIPIDSSDLSQDTRTDFDQSYTLAIGESATFEFDKFQRAGPGPPNADMRGEDVKVTMYFSDGSSITFNLCQGGCDF